MIFTLVRYTIISFLLEFSMLIPMILAFRTLGRHELKLYTVYPDGQTKNEGSMNPKDWFEGFMSIRNLIFPRKNSEPPKEQRVIVDKCGIQLSLGHYIYYFSSVVMVLSEILLGVVSGVLYTKLGQIAAVIQTPMWIGVLISFAVWVIVKAFSGIKVKQVQKTMLVSKTFMVHTSAYFQHHDEEHYMENVQFMDAVRRMLTPDELNEVIESATEYKEGHGRTTDANQLIEEFFKALDEKTFNGASWIHQLSSGGQQIYRRIKESLDASTISSVKNSGKEC